MNTAIFCIPGDIFGAFNQSRNIVYFLVDRYVCSNSKFQCFFLRCCELADINSFAVKSERLIKLQHAVLIVKLEFVLVTLRKTFNLFSSRILYIIGTAGKHLPVIYCSIRDIRIVAIIFYLNKNFDIVLCEIRAAAVNHCHGIFSDTITVRNRCDSAKVVCFLVDIMLIAPRYVVSNLCESDPLSGILLFFLFLPCKVILGIIPFQFFQNEFINLSFSRQSIIDSLLCDKSFRRSDKLAAAIRPQMAFRITTSMHIVAYK